MKAFILAAGLGTRLQPLTNSKPKALVEIKGKTLLELSIRKLQAAGINSFVVNVHHFADLVEQHLAENNNFGADIVISDERAQLLDTGGGLKQALQLVGTSTDILIHNVDVITDIDIAALHREHSQGNNLATLAVRKRETSRYLEFDTKGYLCNWLNTKTGQKKIARPAIGNTERYAFSGIHIISSEILQLMHETGSFSIIDVYLRLAASERIALFDHSNSFWKDLGRYSHWQEMNEKAKGLPFLQKILKQ